MKKIFLLILFFMLSSFTVAFAGAELKIKEPMDRIGIDDKVEIDKINAISEMAKLSVSKRRDVTKKVLTSAEMVNKRISLELAKELNKEKEPMLNDLQFLWVAAVERSETIKFAILKLSNPDGEKVEENKFKKFLMPIASATPMIAAAASPATAAASMLGGGLLGSLLSDNNAKITAHMTKVSDADLIILAKEIDDLQQKLVVLYYNYMTAQKLYDCASRNAWLRKKDYLKYNSSNSAKLLLADTFYQEALDVKYKSHQDFISARVELEQFVGISAVLELEKNIKQRTTPKKQVKTKASLN